MNKENRELEEIHQNFLNDKSPLAYENYKKQLLNWRNKWGVELLDKVANFYADRPREYVEDGDKYFFDKIEEEINKLKQEIEKEVEG